MSNKKRPPDLQDDDVERFEDIQKKYRSRLLGLIRGKVDPKDEEDVLQEVWRRAALGLKNLQDKKKLGPWLDRITGNEITRRRINYKQERERVEIGTDPEAADSKPAADIREEFIFKMDLERALLKLPPEQMEAISLRLFFRCSIEEIARLQGVSIGTAKTRIHLSLKRLRENLNDYSGK